MNSHPDSTDDRLRRDLHRLDHLPLPAHVNVWLHGRWRPAWLIACENQPSGWRGLVQHEDENHLETTEWIAAEQITSRSNP
jgi:hypothetical protein